VTIRRDLYAPLNTTSAIFHEIHRPICTPTADQIRNYQFGVSVNSDLYPSLLKQSLRYQPSASGSLMGRATDAASRIFVTRDESGKRRLNTSYFLGVLTAVAVHTASRPYWARSNSAPFSDFGSTVGNDAGVKLLHEFGPGIRQMVTGHMPEFVSRIEAHIRDQTPREVASIPARSR
jgi:hypothetical protein